VLFLHLILTLHILNLESKMNRCKRKLAQSFAKLLKLGAVASLSLGLCSTAIGASLTPLTLQKVSAGTPVTVLFLGDSDTAGCGAGNDATGNSTFPAAFASLLVNQTPPYIGVTRIDRVGTDDGTSKQNLCPAFAGKTVSLKGGLLGSHTIVRAGVGGYTAFDINANLDAAFANLPAVDLVVVMVGINDSIMQFTTASSNTKVSPQGSIGNATSPEVFKSNLTTLIQSIRKKTSGEILLVTEFTNGGSQNGAIKTQPAFKAHYTYPNDGTPNTPCASTRGSRSSPDYMACDLNLYNKIVMGFDSPSSKVYAFNLHQTLMTAIGIVDENPNTNPNPNNSPAAVLINALLAGDPYHPNNAGYGVIGDQIFYNTLNTATASPPPVISNSGVTKGLLSTWAGWVISSNISPSLRVYVDYIPNNSKSPVHWAIQAMPTISSDKTWLSYSLPTAAVPSDCAINPATSTCTVIVTLKDMITGQASNAFQFQLAK
jgi:lysophospholipase L1-like esterase